MTSQMNNTVAAKLTAVEVTLKDNVSKVVKSKVGITGLASLPVCLFLCLHARDFQGRRFYDFRLSVLLFSGNTEGNIFKCYHLGKLV